MRAPVMAVAATLVAFLILFSGPTPSLGAEGVKRPATSPGAGENVPDWMARWELARTLGYAKRYDESVTEYRKLLKERPGLSKARIEMAKILFWQKKDSEALSVLEGADRRQLDASSVLLLADLYRTRKSYDRAGPLYRDYLKSRPDDHQARLRYAEMLSWEKRYDESLAEYRTILAALPDDTQVRRKYAMVLMWSKKYNEASTELRRTLK